MQFDLFVTVVCVILFLQMVAILLYFPIIPRIKAGDKHDYHFRYGVKRHTSQYLQVDGQMVDVSSMPQYEVAGESMKDYNIHNGQTIYTQSLSMEQVQNLSEYPVLVYRLEKTDITRRLDSNKKLRKFVGYMELTESAEDVFNKYKDRILIDRDTFISEFNERKQLLKEDKENETKHFILSVTHSERLGRNHYSIHATDTVEGMVKYVA